MSTANPSQTVYPTRIGSGLAWVSRQCALAGGAIMLLLATMTVVSIVGRSLFGAAVEGDYELVEVGLALAVFLFLPECYLREGHIIVDLFTSACRPGTLRFLGMISDLLFLLLALVLVWRLTVAGVDAREYREQSMILELPLWIVYIVGAATQALLALCCLDKVYRYFRGLGK